MAKKTKSETVAEVVPDVVSKPVKSSRKKVPAEPVKVEEQSIPQESVECVEEETKLSKKEKIVQIYETLLNNFDVVLDKLETEIKSLKEQDKCKGIKFLKSIQKDVKHLKSQTNKTISHKQKSGSKINVNSGFLKPVKISSEMAKFTGWDPATLRSRVDVTKYICEHIKQKDLQNPSNRREILVNKDKDLSKLLKFDASKETEPMTYYRLQTYLKPHFIKE
jgi:chromatin remodeling complex protein RSC6